MLRLLSCLALVVAPAAAQAWEVSARPQAGEVLAWDSTSTPTHFASADSSMQMPVLGVAAEARPWRRLVVDGSLLFGTGATLDTPQVNPIRTGIGYRRVSVGVGWRLLFEGWGPLRDVTGSVGWGQERWSADQQFMPGADHRQVTPSFSRDEPWLRADAHGLLFDDRLALGAALTAVPWAHVSDDWATDGKKQYAWGLDFSARAEWGLGAVLGSLGELGLGVGFDGGFRRINWSGAGTRTNSQGTAVQDVKERFSHVTVVGFVSWRIAGGGTASALPPAAPETPGTPPSAAPETPGTPPAAAPETPGTPSSTAHETPGTPSAAPETPGTPSSSAHETPGTPSAAPETPGTPPSAAPETPGTPPSAAPETPGTPPAATPETPSTPQSAPPEATPPRPGDAPAPSAPEQPGHGPG
jgi:hypothetical protein